MDDPYHYIPALTIGGPSGDYVLTVPMASCRWAEYSLIGVVNGDAGTGAIVISGDAAPKSLLYDGSVQLNNDAYFTGQPVRIPQTTTFNGHDSNWQRITDSQHRVFVRIDAANGASIYVTVKFRTMPITTIPGPSITVHPDHEHQMNIAREEAALERLKAMNVPMTSYTTDEFGRRIYAAQDKGDQANGRR